MGKVSDMIATAKKLAADIDMSGETKAVPADPNAPEWLRQVAMITGALAALAGFLTVYTTKLTNQAIYESNQAILSQTEASDAWAEYQADSVKAHIVEMQLLPSSPINAADKANLAKMDLEIRSRQPISKQTATDKTAERQSHLTNGFSYLTEKDLLNEAGMAAQLGIALASVAALTRRRIVFHASTLVAAVSVMITAYGFIINYLHGG